MKMLNMDLYDEALQILNDLNITFSYFKINSIAFDSKLTIFVDLYDLIYVKNDFYIETSNKQKRIKFLIAGDDRFAWFG